MKILKFLITPMFMGTLFVVFAVALAAATFIENDFGSQAAYSTVYDTRWFELILLLLAVNLTGQLIAFRMFRKEKLPMAIFHLAFIVMISGAAITRYSGWEGSIHIREGERSGTCYSTEEFLSVKITDKETGSVSSWSKPFTISRLEGFSRTIAAGSNEYKIGVDRIISNAAEVVTDDPEGSPVISLLVTRDMKTRDIIVLRDGESAVAQGVTLGFRSTDSCDINIRIDSGQFFMVSAVETVNMSMMTGESQVLTAGTEVSLKPMNVISINDVKIVPQKLALAGSVTAAAADPSVTETGKNALLFSIVSGEESVPLTVWTTGDLSSYSSNCSAGNAEVKIEWGSKPHVLPFTLHLNDFVLERYPGSSSPSGYRSEVTLNDSSNSFNATYSVYMNNILKYKGYRFFQSSYDNDEKGTVLSVNHDPAGLIVTYSGYALLFLFIIVSLLSRKSFFRTVTAGAWSSPLRKAVSVLLFLTAGSCFSFAQDFVPGKEAAAEFGKTLVQDQTGRTEPLLTLSSDILRKVAKEKKLGEYTSMQVFLGIFYDFNSWQNVPLIKVSNRDLRKSLGLSGTMASFSDLVNLDGNGSYKLSGKVNAAYEKAPGERSKYDKEIMKVDERVNIIYMIYRGDFMKIFPLKNGTTNWGSPREALDIASGSDDLAFLQAVVPLVMEALQDNDRENIKKLASSIRGYQERFAGYELPPASKVAAEGLYNKLDIFERLFKFYPAAGIFMLILLFIRVITGKKGRETLVTVFSWLLFAGFLLHTSGLGLRWYISGHSPMSNGYESMIFISWVTMLAGFIFMRKSGFVLPATSVLAGLTLLVAHMSFMDPEITNLVPVLKSYWLTLHVSVITSSYGFLGLGALLGIITMILLTLLNSRNRERISETIDELLVINFRVITLGLYFLTIGTFLGAIWANESWGRYWGWDPKETWSLITIIVYTLVTHSRMIPGMKSVFVFTFLSVFTFSSVLMTYFGVNYYLSGLHSYAGGDPLPVPAFVYIAVLLLVALCIAAYMKYRKLERK